MRHTLPKSNILRGYQSFSRVISSGACIQGSRLTGYIVSRASDHPGTLIGFTVSKKRMPLAVQRNRIKRLMREAVRKHFFTIELHSKQKKLAVEIVVSFRGEKEKSSMLTLKDIEPEWIHLQQMMMEKL